jgi:hypothetical protein
MRVSESTSTEHFTLMRRIFKLGYLGFVAGVVSACALPDEIVNTTAIPTAGVRFINAVPDTGMMDFGFVDKVENSRHFQIAFRNTPVIAPTTAVGVPASTTVQFKAAEAGSRRYVVFMDGTTGAVASDSVIGATVTLEAGKNYTFLLWGCANPTGPGRAACATNPLAMNFFEDNVAAPSAGNVAVRIINASFASIDASQYTDGTAAPTVAEATWTNIGPLTVGPYITRPSGIVWFRVTSPTGAVTHATVAAQGTVLHRRGLVGAAEILLPPGPFDAVPGTNIAGSAVTGIVFPASIAGTGAPQGTGSTSIPSWTGLAISYMWDRRPPRTPGV